MIGRPMQAMTTSPSAARLSALLRRSALLGVLLLLCVVASFLSPVFFRFDNLVNVARQVALYGIVGLSMTLVILTRGIDLSVGSIVGVVAVTSALALSRGLPAIPTVALGLVIGALMGAVNGLGVTLGRVPPFIMTLGMMVVGRGLTMMISGGSPVNLGAAGEASFTWLGAGRVLSLPVPIWIFAGLAVALHVMLKATPFGRAIYAFWL